MPPHSPLPPSSIVFTLLFIAIHHFIAFPSMVVDRDLFFFCFAFLRPLVATIRMNGRLSHCLFNCCTITTITVIGFSPTVVIYNCFFWTISNNFLIILILSRIALFTPLLELIIFDLTRHSVIRFILIVRFFIARFRIARFFIARFLTVIVITITIIRILVLISPFVCLFFLLLILVIP